jgi:hypothetical protein
MAKKISLNRAKAKKTHQGCSTNTKWYPKGGGANGSKASKLYRKKYRGQGRR